MSSFEKSVPQSIIDYNGNNTNIPNKDQLEDYFIKIRDMLDFIRIFLIVNYSYIGDIPVRNMFKLLYVPLNTNTTEPPSKKRKTPLKTELQEPIYISINCEIDFNQILNLALTRHSDPRRITFNDNVYFQAVSKLDDVVEVDSLYKNFGKKNMSIGEFSLENLDKEYCLYCFKDNVNFFMPTNNSFYAKICYKYFEEKTLQNVIKTIDDNVYTCSVLELNKPFFDNLPELSENINLGYFNDETIDSYIFKDSDDRYIELPPRPIEVNAEGEEPFTFTNVKQIYGNIDNIDNIDNDININQESNIKTELPSAISNAKPLYTTKYPSSGIVFTNKPELPIYNSKREQSEQVPKRHRPFGGTKHKKKAQNRKTKKAKKVKRNTKLHFTQEIN
jgi:hypothetical protein